MTCYQKKKHKGANPVQLADNIGGNALSRSVIQWKLIKALTVEAKDTSQSNNFCISGNILHRRSIHDYSIIEALEI